VAGLRAVVAALQEMALAQELREMADKAVAVEVAMDLLIHPEMV